MRVGGKVYLSAGDDNDFSGEAADIEFVELQMKQYADEGVQPYSFFTTYKPDHVI